MAVLPDIIAPLMAFGILRFNRTETVNKELYITIGACLVTGIALKQLGSVKGARKG